MSGRQLEMVVDQDGPINLAEAREAFGIVDKPIDSPTRRLHAWALIATAGINMLRVDQLLYSWDTQPVKQKNGAVRGRVYAQARGESPRDVGGYKIDARGRVLELPAALRQVLPGGADAGEEVTS